MKQLYFLLRPHSENLVYTCIALHMSVRPAVVKLVLLITGDLLDLQSYDLAH